MTATTDEYADEAQAEIVTGAVNIPVDEVELTDGEDLFQSGPSEGYTEGEYEYQLTAFVPKCNKPKDSRTVPTGAALWIIPDLADVKYMRTLKLFKMTWLEKIPASYNVLYVRPGADNRPNPTPFQKEIIRSTISRFTDDNGLPQVGQTVLIPIINLYDGQQIPTIGEMSNACYKELVKFNDAADDNTDGMMTTKTRAIYLWREGQKEYGFKFHKGDDIDVKAVLAEVGDDVPDVKAYVKKRAVLTEKWLFKKWTDWKNGVLTGGADDGAPETRSEQYVDALMDLPTPVLKTVLTDAGLSITGLRSKQALVDLAMGHEELLFEDVLAARPKPDFVE